MIAGCARVFCACRQKSSLVAEGSLMSRLKHERVVKLLGVILEDRDYSLVMELIPKGNLLAMLQKVRTLGSLISKTPEVSSAGVSTVPALLNECVAEKRARGSGDLQTDY